LRTALSVIGFDADDTLWHNERYYRLTEERFVALLRDHVDGDHVSERLLAAERRNLVLYGFGIKGFTLSMIETAIEVTDGKAPASVIAEILAAGRELMAHPVDPLPPAPLPGLSQPGPNGPLPVVGAGGQTSFKAYRRPFKPDPKKAKIAVIVGGLGFNAAATDQAIADLPADVTLSFVPYAQNLQSWIDKARAAGHEVIVELPMEPFDVDEDTGPQTLLVGLDAKANLARLEYLLGRAAGYFAVMNYQGAKFSGSQSAAPPVVKALHDRGLAFVGNGIGSRSALGGEAYKQGLPFVSADRVLDIRRDAEAIDDQLLNLEALALQNGSALGAGFAYPVTIEQIKFWSESLGERGYQLAPASAVMDMRGKSK